MNLLLFLRCTIWNLKKKRTKNCQKSSFCCDGKAKVRPDLRAELKRMRIWKTEQNLVKKRMRSSRMIRASDCQCRSRNSSGFDPSILRHSGIWAAADPEAVLNTINSKKNKKNPPVKKKARNSRVCNLHLSESISSEVLRMALPACSWGTLGLCCSC
jgi:hypothetical protein